MPLAGMGDLDETCALVAAVVGIQDDDRLVSTLADS